MKKRIQTDSILVSFLVILTGVLCLFPNLYSRSWFVDGIFDFFGVMSILKGIYFRMAARGHKKAHSQKGKGLVKSGFYGYTRNPMYLGSFTIGVGFVLLVWPWWLLPVFMLMFYIRFRKQVVFEEQHLEQLFGEEYLQYCEKVPRVFPRFKEALKMNVSKTLIWSEVWSTNEKRQLFFMPLLAFVLESFQEIVVFKTTYLGETALIFAAAAVTFAVGLWYRYRH